MGPALTSTLSQRERERHGAITKEAVFHYVYAVLHDPVYREKYAINLKRDFPRIPLYGGGESGDAAFWQWSGWAPN